MESEVEGRAGGQDSNRGGVRSRAALEDKTVIEGSARGQDSNQGEARSRAALEDKRVIKGK